MIKCSFLDIGGVLLTNGWGTDERVGAAKKFDIDYHEMDSRHRMVFDTYERGKMSLNEYLDIVVFFKPRSFTKEQFIDYMRSVTKPFPNMLNLMKTLKQKYNLKVAAVSNEGRDIQNYRIDHFDLKELFDCFVVSSFVHLKKPDLDIYRLALDLMHVKPEEVIYIDDRPLFVEIGKSLGLNAIQHKNYQDTKQQLEQILKP